MFSDGLIRLIISTFQFMSVQEVELASNNCHTYIETIKELKRLKAYFSLEKHENRALFAIKINEQQLAIFDFN